ncbi:MAG: hypothetical protein KJ583_00075, partial [Nanoarchaeota archaeon]|nr:hypothetical protein [Nanoarchaeota archaeon]
CPLGRIIGDVSGDGLVGAYDSSLVQMMLGGSLGLPSDICCVDVSQNGVVDSNDSVLIQRITVGLDVSPGVCGGSGGATCSDGVQNQGETGVDCGGRCPACPPSNNQFIDLTVEKVNWPTYFAARIKDINNPYAHTGANPIATADIIILNAKVNNVGNVGYGYGTNITYNQPWDPYGISICIYYETYGQLRTVGGGTGCYYNDGWDKFVKLAAGESRNLQVGMPAFCGVFKYILKVDGSNKIVETNENNNEVTGTVYVFCRPDPGIKKEGTWPTSVNGGNTIDFTYSTLPNTRGRPDTGDTLIKLFIDDILIATNRHDPNTQLWSKFSWNAVCSGSGTQEQKRLKLVTSYQNISSSEDTNLSNNELTHDITITCDSCLGKICSSDSDCCSGNYCYTDLDGDGYVPTSGTKTCRATHPKNGVDCCDNDDKSHPEPDVYGSTSKNKCGSWDWNCDGQITKSQVTYYNCSQKSPMYIKGTSCVKKPDIVWKKDCVFGGYEQNVACGQNIFNDPINDKWYAISSYSSQSGQYYSDSTCSNPYPTGTSNLFGSEGSGAGVSCK